MTLRIVLVDDHDIVRDGLRSVLARQSEMVVAGEAANAHDAYPAVAAAAPCLVMLDVALPGTDGIAVTRELLRRDPGCRVLIFTMHQDPDLVLQSFAAGARGYALKDQSTAALLDAVRAVGRGERYLAPRLPRHLLEGARVGRAHAELPDLLGRLSPREREVFNLVVRGFSSLNIAAELSISAKTVETHRSSIHRKLGVHSTVELVRLAALRGLVTP